MHAVRRRMSRETARNKKFLFLYFLWRLKSIPQRLAGFQHMRDARDSFWRADQFHEFAPFELEHLSSVVGEVKSRSPPHSTAAKAFDTVTSCGKALPTRRNPSIARSQRRASCRPRQIEYQRLRRFIILCQFQHALFGIKQQTVAVHRDAVGLAQIHHVRARRKPISRLWPC